MSTLEAKLRDSSHAGPYLAPPDLDALLLAVKKSALKLLRVDLSGARDKQSLLDAIARSLEFPDWFGGNWDALEDCLIDLSWIKARGYFMLLDNCGELAKYAPRELAKSIEVFESVAEYWDEQDKPFWTVFCGIETPVSGVKPLS
jgi:RNAse (barnase) inhibitor barstar